MNEVVDYLFYATEGCHLCEVAEQLIAEVMTPRESIEYVEIAQSDALVAKYGLTIPVLQCVRTQQQLMWPFTAEQVQSLFTES
ncbi:glutaredoxin family protein [Thiopseudomonas alkaliphila]|uniref:glutaredoxin family protein n=1 Tax=Thiopseudomonas alkaliphila TaxID=1697053 RepID=UPI00069F5CB3|nr:glutaredoxin family protein [Thiopseudomonas alkaliphila]AKX50143.1 hypothetical protein AKN92_00510 [Thiopseudomonas alkaliphila]AKX56479.1 hypothetical protein AKN89_00510 [Thiopseudomonas alkaliphila]